MLILMLNLKLIYKTILLAIRFTIYAMEKERWIQGEFNLYSFHPQAH